MSCASGAPRHRSSRVVRAWRRSDRWGPKAKRLAKVPFLLAQESKVLLKLALRLEHRPKPNGRRKRPWRGRGEELGERCFLRGQWLSGGAIRPGRYALARGHMRASRGSSSRRAARPDQTTNTKRQQRPLVLEPPDPPLDSGATRALARAEPP